MTENEDVTAPRRACQTGSGRGSTLIRLRVQTQREQAGSHVYDVLSNFRAQSQPVCERDEPIKDRHYAFGSHAFLLQPFPLVLI